MKSGHNRIKILNRQADGFACTIHPAQPKETICRICGAPKTAHDGDCPEENDPLLKREAATLGEPPVNHCLNCPTEIEPQENFCGHCFSQIPEDLLGAWFNCRTQNGRLLALQGMLDHLARPFADQHDSANCQHCQSIEHHKPGEPIPLAYWDNLIREITEDITGQQKMLADITALRAKQYPAEAK